MQNATSADLDIADYDNDGDIDFVYSGFINSNNTYTGSIKTTRPWKTTNSGVPTGLIARQVGSGMLFFRGMPSDDTENGEQLSYNITAGTSSGQLSDHMSLIPDFLTENG